MENNLHGFIKEVVEFTIKNHDEDYNLNESQIRSIVEAVNSDDDYLAVIWEETEIAITNAYIRNILQGEE